MDQIQWDFEVSKEFIEFTLRILKFEVSHLGPLVKFIKVFFINSHQLQFEQELLSLIWTEL